MADEEQMLRSKRIEGFEDGAAYVEAAGQIVTANDMLGNLSSDTGIARQELDVSRGLYTSGQDTMKRIQRGYRDDLSLKSPTARHAMELGKTIFAQRYGTEAAKHGLQGLEEKTGEKE